MVKRTVAGVRRNGRTDNANNIGDVSLYDNQPAHIGLATRIARVNDNAQRHIDSVSTGGIRNGESKFDGLA